MYSHDDNLVLWLDASNSDSLDLGDEKQVLLWKDLSTKSNHASGAALNAVACSFKHVITGGYHRNLLNSDDTGDWNQTYQLGSKRTTEYNLNDMVCTEKNPDDDTEIKFVALLNDGLSSFTDSYPSDDLQNGIIAYSKNGTSWTLNDLSTTYLQNDMFYSPSRNTIFVVGNNGSMFTSSDHGVSWDTVDSGTNLNLLAGCIR